MKNFEKHSKEEIIKAAGDFRNPAVSNGKLTNCVKINCDACDLKKIRENCKDYVQAFIVWLYSEADPEKEENKNDPVNHPSHYTDGKIEVIDYIEDKGLGFCLGNAIKYISLVDKKSQNKEIEDLQKAIWYIERRIEQIRKEKSDE